MIPFDTGAAVGAFGVSFTGVAVATVTANVDSLGLGRVKVRYPWMAEACESDWCRVVTPMAGFGRGLYALPDVGDEVLVAFEQGRPEHAFVLGSLWHGKAPPPVKNIDPHNARRTWVSKSGHTLTFDDTPGAEQVRVVERSTLASITLRSADRAVIIEASGPIILSTSVGDVTLSATLGDVILDAPAGKVVIGGSAIEANATTTATVGGQMVTVEGGASVAIKGPGGVDVNDGALKVV